MGRSMVDKVMRGASIIIFLLLWKNHLNFELLVDGNRVRVVEYVSRI